METTGQSPWARRDKVASWMGGADRASGYDNHDRRSEFWAGRLEIRLADTGTISPTAGQAATRTIASVEFQVIGARSNRPDDGEATVAVNVGRNNAKFHRCDASGNTLPCNRGAGTTGAAWKLAERLRKRAAEDVNTDLVELVVRRAHQVKGHRQLAGGRRHGPRDIAGGEVKRFTEIVPPCGLFLRCRGSRS